MLVTCPANRVVGISKLARVVHGFARRLQIQEKLTVEIAGAIQDILQPRGVGVVIEAEHNCMTLRGVNTTGSKLTTSSLLGVMRDDRERAKNSLALCAADKRRRENCYLRARSIWISARRL